MLVASQVRGLVKLPSILLPRVLASSTLPAVTQTKIFSTSPLTSKYYSSWAESGDVTYEELNNLIKTKNPKEVVLVDVRERSELQAGKIPTSINLPLKELPKALQLDENEFVAAYGFPKFSKDNHLVVYCYAGKRSAMAKEIIQKLGYTNVRNYPGSWCEYSEKSQNKQ